MSFYKIKFKKENIGNPEKTELILRKYIKNSPINAGFDYDKNNFIAYGEINDNYNCQEWGKIFDIINSIDGRDSIIEIFIDQTGETLYYAIHDMIVREYLDIDELKESKYNKKGGDIKMDNSTKSLLIRIKAKKKLLNKLNEIFSLEERTEIEKRFNNLPLIDSEEKIKWPSFEGSNGKWYEGPKDILNGLSSVVTDDKHIVLDFNLDDIEYNYDQIDNLICMMLLTGTDKIWAKCRDRPGKECVFMSHEGETDFYKRERSQDEDWSM